MSTVILGVLFVVVLALYLMRRRARIRAENDF
jgi:hypothetical protein